MTRSLVLASASPRRRELLHAAGFAPRVIESDLDDANLARGSAVPEYFVAALAWFKAARVIEMHAPRDAIVLAADTVCVAHDRLLGKPRDAQEARAILESLRGCSHRTLTGVAAVEPNGRRHFFVDVARVSIGAIDDASIEAYVASGKWSGKAGGYNYAERVDAGWPLMCAGDATSVMGLPIARTAALLSFLGVSRAETEAC